MRPQAFAEEAYFELPGMLRRALAPESKLSNPRVLALRPIPTVDCYFRLYSNVTVSEELLLTT